MTKKVTRFFRLFFFFRVSSNVRNLNKTVTRNDEEQLVQVVGVHHATAHN